MKKYDKPIAETVAAAAPALLTMSETYTNSASNKRQLTKENVVVWEEEDF